MDTRKISDSFSVSPQIEPDDLQTIADAGYRSVMCNRPDGEEFGQPDFAVIEEAAKAVGLNVCWVPVAGVAITPETMDDFSGALKTLPAPMLAYCRTGTRCTMLWAISQFGTLPDDQILSATSEAGYDMAGLIAQLRQSA